MKGLRYEENAHMPGCSQAREQNSLASQGRLARKQRVFHSLSIEIEEMVGRSISLHSFICSTRQSFPWCSPIGEAFIWLASMCLCLSVPDLYSLLLICISIPLQK